MPTILQVPVGYQTKTATISNSAVLITAAGWSWTAGYVAAADAACITAFSQPIVMTYDGTTPTTAVGVYIPAGSTIRVIGQTNVANVQLIRAGGTNATASITLEKFP